MIVWKKITKKSKNQYTHISENEVVFQTPESFHKALNVPIWNNLHYIVVKNKKQLAGELVVRVASRERDKMGGRVVFPSNEGTVCPLCTF